MEYGETQKIEQLLIDRQRTIATMYDARRRGISDVNWRNMKNEYFRPIHEQRLTTYGLPGCDVHFARLVHLSVAANVCRPREQETAKIPNAATNTTRRGGRATPAHSTIPNNT